MGDFAAITALLQPGVSHCTLDGSLPASRQVITSTLMPTLSRWLLTWRAYLDTCLSWALPARPTRSTSSSSSRLGPCMRQCVRCLHADGAFTVRLAQHHGR